MMPWTFPTLMFLGALGGVLYAWWDIRLWQIELECAAQRGWDAADDVHRRLTIARAEVARLRAHVSLLSRARGPIDDGPTRRIESPRVIDTSD